MYYRSQKSQNTVCLRRSRRQVGSGSEMSPRNSVIGSLKSRPANFALLNCGFPKILRAIGLVPLNDLQSPNIEKGIG